MMQSAFTHKSDQTTCCSSLPGITTLSILISFLLTAFYANIIFYQFPLYKIILIASLFLVILFLLTYLFDKNYFKQKLHFDKHTILYAFILSCILILIAGTSLEDATYYRAYPLLEADLGLGAHPDSSFHVALIQSIISFGYPSTGQHDVPLTFYHLLSHYIDSMILSITGLDPLDSYGFLYYFKVIFFLSSVIIFISQVLKDRSSWLLILSFFIVGPMLVSTWTPVFSHALWFTSVIAVLSATFLYKLLTKEKKLKHLDYLFLLLYIVLLSMGKVSLGFIYATFIGMYLMLKNWKDYRLYITGLMWILFFILFQKLFNSTGRETSFHSIDVLSLFDFFINPSQSPFGMLLSIYTSIALLFLLSIIYKEKEIIRFIFAALFSLIVIGIVVITHRGFISADIFYFEYSLAFILILFVFQIAFKYIRSTKQQLFSLMAFCIFILPFYYLPKFNILTITPDTSLKMINKRPFLHINRQLPSQKFSFLTGGLPSHWIEQQHQPLKNFRLSLDHYMNDHHLNATNSVLYIPREIFENDLSFVTSQKWSTGLFMYALTGIPLLYGNKTLHKGYGYQNYSEKSLWVFQTDFNNTRACRFLTNKNIVVLKNFNPATFETIECNKTKP